VANRYRRAGGLTGSRYRRGRRRPRNRKKTLLLATAAVAAALLGALLADCLGAVWP
jgi:hypothetical protein